MSWEMHLSSSAPTWMPAQLPFGWRREDCMLSGWWNDKQIVLLWEVRASDLRKGSAQLLRTASITLQGLTTAHWFCITFRLTSEKIQISNKVKQRLFSINKLIMKSKTGICMQEVLQNTKQNATQAADDSTDTFKHDNWQKRVEWFALKSEK